jgi:hypothetical protein
MKFSLGKPKPLLKLMTSMILLSWEASAFFMVLIKGGKIYDCVFGVYIFVGIGFCSRMRKT